MLTNALSMLVHFTQRVIVNPDVPVAYLHRSGDTTYQIIVQKLPKQEKQAA